MSRLASGFLWTFSERFSGQIVSFVISIVLARLLLPSDYGLIGMIAIVIAIGKILAESGMTSSLIRKFDTNDADYSTVFFMNLLVSICVFFVIYLSAPIISVFYNQQILTSMLRVLAVVIIIRALGAVQRTKLTKELKFKPQFIISLISNILGGLTGIYLALNDYGVWSLIYMQITTSIVTTFLLWVNSSWTPKAIFSMKVLKEHISFGINLSISGLINEVFNNIYHVVIGRYYDPALLGFYTRADSLKQLPVKNISSAVNKVSYPVLSSIQNNPEELRLMYKKIMLQVSYWISPILVGMMVLAEPLFSFLLTDKWLPAVPYFQILCVSGILYPIHAYNLNILNVKGRSDLFLRLEVIKKILVVIGITFALPFGVIGLVWVKVVLSVIALVINTFYSGRMIDYSLIDQFKDLGPNLALAAVMGTIVMGITHLLDGLSDIIILAITVSSGAFIYLVLSILTKNESLQQIKMLFLRLYQPNN